MNENISIINFLKNKYSLDTFMDTFITTLFIFIVIYLFAIVRSNYTISLVIVMSIVFFFIDNLKNKYNELYNMKVKELKFKASQIKKRIYEILKTK